MKEATRERALGVVEALRLLALLLLPHWLQQLLSRHMPMGAHITPIPTLVWWGLFLAIARMTERC